jgi:hypothetical protein
VPDDEKKPSKVSDADFVRFRTNIMRAMSGATLEAIKSMPRGDEQTILIENVATGMKKAAEAIDRIFDLIEAKGLAR